MVFLRPLALVALLAAFAPSAGAVTILDSTWKAEGGGKGREAAGFGAHLRLAAEPQFKPVLSLSSDGETWGEASGTWLGNDDGHAYILTAAHIYEDPASAEDYAVRGPDGRVYHGDKLWLHPRWTGDVDTRSGYDIAILRLTRPIRDLGPQPLLYTGTGEAGELITFVGYGNRGIGSRGEHERFYTGTDKAAAQGVVDEWLPLDRKAAEDEDAGNYLGVFMPMEDGSLPNPYGGADKPATRLVGLLGEGDSGGSAWMRLGGQWVIVGINSSGDGDAGYGDSSWFSRVSPHRAWIGKIFPGTRFAE